MNKIPKEEILSFRDNISSILSQERLESKESLKLISPKSHIPQQDLKS